MQRFFPAGVVAIGLLAAAPARADIALRIDNGRVTLTAKDATIAQILAEWARVGQTKIVNGERLAGPPVTLELNGVPEETALGILLRSASGYLLGQRTADEPNASRFNRILIMPTSVAPRPSAPAPAAPPPQFGQPTFPQPSLSPPPLPPPIPDEVPPDQEPVQREQPLPPNQRGPVFQTFPVPQNGPQPAQQPAGQNIPAGQNVPAMAAPPSSTPIVPAGVAVPGMPVPVPTPQQPVQSPQPERRPGF